MQPSVMRKLVAARQPANNQPRPGNRSGPGTDLLKALQRLRDERDVLAKAAADKKAGKA